METGDKIPELKVTPDRFLPHRYAGASGDFNPIHIDSELAQQFGLPRQHPPRPLRRWRWWRAPTPRPSAATRAALRRLSVQFRGMGVPEEEITVSGTVVEAGDGRIVVDTVAEQGGNADHQATRRPSSAHQTLTWRRTMQSPRQQFILRKVVEGRNALDSPVGSRWLAEQDDVPWGPSTVRAELARLEDAGLLEHPHTSAGRIPTDRGYRFYVDELLTGDDLPAVRKRRRAERHPARGGRRDARHDRAALAGDEPPRARIRPADRDRDDPPRRGAAAAAAAWRWWW